MSTTKTKFIHVRLDPKTFAQIGKLAEGWGVSLSAIARKLIMDSLKQ